MNGIEKKKILFICTHNSARSQMAEGFVRTMYGDRYDELSGGTEPYEVNLYAVRVMEEIGIDISHQKAKSIDQFLNEKIDDVVTVCDQANEACPFFPGAKNTFHKGFQDPGQVEGTEEEILSTFRKVRDEIKEWIEETFGNQESDKIP